MDNSLIDDVWLLIFKRNIFNQNNFIRIEIFWKYQSIKWSNMEYSVLRAMLFRLKDEEIFKKNFDKRLTDVSNIIQVFLQLLALLPGKKRRGSNVAIYAINSI